MFHMISDHRADTSIIGINNRLIMAPLRIRTLNAIHVSICVM